MVKAKFKRGLAGRIAVLERRLAELEGRLIDAQAEYENSSRELTDMRALSRQLAQWGLKASDTGKRQMCIRDRGWPAIVSNAHRVVRREDMALHVLLHRCAFTPYCHLDGVSYSDLPVSYRSYL